MGWLQISTDGGKTGYLPGETVSGSVRWQFEQQAEGIDVRLFWYTQGKGTRDVGVSDSQRIKAPPLAGRESFSFVLPDAPYSFSGKLISLLWAVEAVVHPGDEAGIVEIVMSPDGGEIVLPEGVPKQ
jgi:hypothetical protein